MGLDMYLTAEKYISGYSERTKRDIALEGLEGDHPPTTEGTSVTISLDLACWRKANQIHQWFVDNVQHGVDECAPHTVSLDDLCALRDTCRRVLDDRQLAEELLPPQAGFFFGSTEIDEGYWQDLEETWRVLEEVCNWTDLDKFSFTYQSSW